MSDVRNPDQFKLYHGTVQRNIESIMREGLKAQIPGGSEVERGVYAVDYPARAAAIALARANRAGETSTPAVVSFKRPEDAEFGTGGPRPEFVARIPRDVPASELTVEDYNELKKLPMPTPKKRKR